MLAVEDAGVADRSHDMLRLQRCTSSGKGRPKSARVAVAPDHLFRSRTSSGHLIADGLDVRSALTLQPPTFILALLTSVKFPASRRVRIMNKQSVAIMGGHHIRYSR